MGTTSGINTSHVRLHKFQGREALNPEFLTKALVLLVIAINGGKSKYSSHMLSGFCIRRRKVFTMTAPSG
jgi:hypothetical protein